MISMTTDLFNSHDPKMVYSCDLALTDQEERERIRELSRYYCTVAQSTPPTGDSLTGDEQPATSELAKDITLTALAQLGVLRFNANRSFVSIIDGDTQHIIAEATGSISLRNKERHAPGNGIYLGARSLDLQWGVCPHTIRLFTGREPLAIESGNVTANRSRYIIRDFTREDCFKDRPYVKEWPHMRFYAEVPLFSSSGYVLGSYCIVDDKPRTEFGDEQVNDLQEVADAIGVHLENMRMSQTHLRAERLVKGLTNFAKEHAGFDPSEASNGGRIQSSVSAAHLARSELPETPVGPVPPIPVLMDPITKPTEAESPDSGQSSLSTITGDESGFFLQDQKSSTDPSSLYSVSDRPVVLSPGEEKSLGDTMKVVDTGALNIDKGFSQLSIDERKPTAERIATIYSRASELLRDSMDLDGVTLLDACPTNFSFVPDELESWEPSTKPAVPGFPNMPLPSPLGLPRVISHEFNHPSDILSCALKSPPNSNTSSGLPVITKGLLHQLIRTCPQGQVFTLEDPVEEDYHTHGSADGFDYTSDITDIPAISNRLARHLPGAKSAIFLPLWDWNKSRWLSGVIAWTKSSYRALGLEELHYFNVFGDSIISEISRIHWASDERSKFDFISSVSHELRSPLHGILASAELLNATSLDVVQNEMVDMIERSGLTLLDTTNHILDFCKVSNLRHSKVLTVGSLNDTANLISDFDVSHLVEEVTNILYAGHRAPGQLTQGPRKMSSDSVAIDPNGQSIPTPQMSVVVRIDEYDTWKIRSLAGAWRRIVMNLLGNAMKWTTAGFIEISLSKTKNQSDSQSLVHLSITDTGKGIAADFLKHKLFAPFSQEDPLSEGVGLGLSTVHQLVTSLGGHVNVRSEIGIGTQADVYLPVQYLPADIDTTIPSAPKATNDDSGSIHACLVGFNGYPDLTETPTGILTVEGKRQLCIQSTLAGIFMSNPNWKISLADCIEEAHGQVVVIEEDLLRRAMREKQKDVAEMAAQYGFDFLVVLYGNAPIDPDPSSVHLVRVVQPFGPQKIYNALEQMMKRRDESLPAAPLESLGVIEPSVSESPNIDLSATASSNAEDQMKHEPSIETKSSSGDSNTSTPRTTPCPPRKQFSAHVLVVDDNDINLKIMATFMKKINCSYDTASNGLIALEKYKASSTQYDFVLMDISMPVMDGLVSTGKIREHERQVGLKPACIMAVTGVSSAGFQDQAYIAGIDNYLIKPLSLNDLKSRMNLA